MSICTCEKCGCQFSTEVHETLGPLETKCSGCRQEDTCKECGLEGTDTCEGCAIKV